MCFKASTELSALSLAAWWRDVMWAMHLGRTVARLLLLLPEGFLTAD